MLQPIDLLEELNRERKKILQEEALLVQANVLLAVAEKADKEVLSGLSTGGALQSIDIAGLNPKWVYSISEIHIICTKYRLRFLGSGRFKGEIPYQAIMAIKRFEKLTGVKNASYNLVAPDELFQLEDSMKDPLLFADLGNGKHYLIHKWGNDMSVWQKMKNFPFRSIYTLGLTVFLAAFLITSLLPIGLDGSSMFKAFLIKASFCSMLSGVLFFTSISYGILYAKGFSEDEWDSRFFN